MIRKRTLNAGTQQELSAKQSENSKIYYVINWKTEIIDGDTVNTSTWTAEDSGVNLTGEANVNNETGVFINGDPGRYRIVNKVVTAAGEELERFIDLMITENTKYYSTDWGYYNWRW